MIKDFKTWLVVNHIKQLEIANLLGVTLQTINKKINGKSDWTLSEVRTICKEYGLSADIFIE